MPGNVWRGAEENEQMILGNIENEIAKYQNEEEYDENAIANKFENDNTGEIKIGDYVKYIPDSETTSYVVQGQYATSNGGADQTHTREEDLQWRVLDKTEDGRVRLISDRPTTFKLTLQGANGYNNVVKLIDDLCAIYGGNKGTARGLKIEDIEKHLTIDYTQDGSNNPDFEYGKTTVIDYTYYLNYPNILKYEKTVAIDDINGNELNMSEQHSFVSGVSDALYSLTITDTCWVKQTSYFSIYRFDAYHELFNSRVVFVLYERNVEE